MGKIKKTVKSTERSLRWLREHGYEAGLVERRIPRVFTTVDLFGFLDIIAIAPRQIIGVQSCIGNLQPHLRKIEAEPRAVKWLLAGGLIHVHDWRKLKLKRGGLAVTWEVKRMAGRLQVTLDPTDNKIEWEEIKEAVKQ